MAHRCDYIDRFAIYKVNGKKYIAKVTDAYWKLKSLDVYVELDVNYEKDTKNKRWYKRENLIYRNMCGWSVVFPGEKLISWYYGTREFFFEAWDWCAKRITALRSCNKVLKKDIKDSILKLYPNFEYVFYKIPEKHKDFTTVFEIFNVWLLYPQIEFLIMLGFVDLALNQNFLKLTDKNKKKIIDYIKKNFELCKEHSFLKELRLCDIQQCMKYKLNFLEYYEYVEFTRFKNKGYLLKYPMYKYCMNKKIDYLEYLDYLDMAKSNGHDINDKYWLYPSDFVKQHNKVMEEKKNVELLNSNLRSDLLKEVLHDFIPYNTNIDGYDVFVTSDIKVIQKQCDTLYQCLIRNNYINKVIDQEEILVFIWKDGKPLYTAEVFYDGKIGQFYGDERDRSKCSAPEDIRLILNKYLELIELKKRKFKTKKLYYKGFHKKLDAEHFYTSVGDFTFEVGKIYKTHFDDNDILELGGKKCVSTNKIFHFCDNVKEISMHYSPKYYCVVEPLGPILEHEGAFLSNKIKIVRELTADEVSLHLR